MASWIPRRALPEEIKPPRIRGNPDIPKPSRWLVCCTPQEARASIDNRWVVTVYSRSSGETKVKLVKRLWTDGTLSYYEFERITPKPVGADFFKRKHLDRKRLKAVQDKINNQVAQMQKQHAEDY